MKSLIQKNILLFLFAMFLTVGSNAQISKAQIRATGLTCSMCSNAIFKQLKSLPDVINVETDLNTSTFFVTLSDSNSATPLIFKNKVEQAGFSIGSLIVTFNTKTAMKSPYILIGESRIKSDKIQAQILDKGYVTAKEFKKLQKSLKNIATFAANNEGDFHIKIVN